jgi:hypothetical protein
MDPSERSVDELRKPTWIERISNRRRLQKTAAYVSDEGLLPSFFVVGPPRTGTSWLHEVLRWHAVLPFPNTSRYTANLTEWQKTFGAEKSPEPRSHRVEELQTPVALRCSLGGHLSTR